MSELMLAVLEENRTKSRFLLHDFVIMPDHIHLLLTPAHEISLEKCLQFVKGGFSYRAKHELDCPLEIWQKGFTEHRVKGTRDYVFHADYIGMNPVRRRLVSCAEEYPYSSARFRMDEPPAHLHG
jgi:putative transposase